MVRSSLIALLATLASIAATEARAESGLVIEVNPPGLEQILRSFVPSQVGSPAAKRRVVAASVCKVAQGNAEVFLILVPGSAPTPEDPTVLAAADCALTPQQAVDRTKGTAGSDIVAVRGALEAKTGSQLALRLTQGYRRSTVDGRKFSDTPLHPRALVELTSAFPVVDVSGFDIPVRFSNGFYAVDMAARVQFVVDRVLLFATPRGPAASAILAAATPPPALGFDPKSPQFRARLPLAMLKSIAAGMVASVPRLELFPHQKTTNAVLLNSVDVSTGGDDLTLVLVGTYDGSGIFHQTFKMTATFVPKDGVLAGSNCLVKPQGQATGVVKILVGKVADAMTARCKADNATALLPPANAHIHVPLGYGGERRTVLISPIHGSVVRATEAQLILDGNFAP